MQSVREHNSEYEDHLRALEAGEPFTARLTGKAAKKAQDSRGKKRKNTRGGKGGSSKRTRISNDDDSDFDMDDIESDVGSDSDSDKDSDDEKDSDEEKDSDDDDASKHSGSDGEGSDQEEEEVTQESLKAKIDECKAAIKAARERLSEVRKAKKEANDNLSTLKKNIGRAQKEKNAFCSLERSKVSFLQKISGFYRSNLSSQFSREVLKVRFSVPLICSCPKCMIGGLPTGFERPRRRCCRRTRSR